MKTGGPVQTWERRKKNMENNPAHAQGREIALGLSVTTKEHKVTTFSCDVTAVIREVSLLCRPDKITRT